MVVLDWVSFWTISKPRNLEKIGVTQIVSDYLGVVVYSSFVLEDVGFTVKVWSPKDVEPEEILSKSPDKATTDLMRLDSRAEVRTVSGGISDYP